jgi:hypothetical protein
MRQAALAAAARFREHARLCRRTAFVMEPSFAKDAVFRLAARWELMARAEAQAVVELAEPALANDA